MSPIDVGGMTITLHQLQDELIAAGIPIEHGLIIDASHEVLPPPGQAPPPGYFPPGAVLYQADANGQRVELPPEAQAIVEAHIPA